MDHVFMETNTLERIGAIGIKVISYLFLILIGLVTFLLAEGWIIGLVFLLGAIKAFLVLLVICVCISFAIVYFYDHTRNRGRVHVLGERIQVWIAKKEGTLNPVTLKLAQISKLLALVFSTVTVGPFLTTVTIKFLGYKKWTDYVFAFMSSTLFCFVWVAIYSGAIAVLSNIFV